MSAIAATWEELPGHSKGEFAAADEALGVSTPVTLPFSRRMLVTSHSWMSPWHRGHGRRPMRRRHGAPCRRAAGWAALDGKARVVEVEERDHLLDLRPVPSSGYYH